MAFGQILGPVKEEIIKSFNNQTINQLLID